jgi:hypothetical protein
MRIGIVVNVTELIADSLRRLSPTAALRRSAPSGSKEDGDASGDMRRMREVLRLKFVGGVRPVRLPVGLEAVRL